jgi:hypothetical protein
MGFVSILPPLLGQFTAMYLFLSPLREVRNQRKKGELLIDSIPFCVTLVQHFLWIAFACLLEDLWIFTPNCVGVFLTVFYTTSALRFGIDDAQGRKMEWLLSCGLGFSVLFSMFVMTSICIESVEVRKQIAGNVCIVIAVAMYGAPCFEAIRAVRTGDASKLSLPLAIAGALNGALWGTYGMAIGVVAVTVPNALGFALSVFNVLIKLFLSFANQKSRASRERSSSTLHFETLQEECEVLIHSVPHQLQLYVPPATNSEVELEAGPRAVQVRAASQGVAVKLLRMPGGAFALRLGDGRFLQVHANVSTTVSEQQNAFGVLAKHCDTPGESGTFLAVPAGGMALHHTETRMHDYDQNTISFWNPLHKVFLRVNEHGVFDCSARMNPSDTGTPRLPKGWHWERFELHSAGCIIGNADTYDI